MKNNKGFSLVELIIVIAIMAVLVGVLAPTYLQYVEKSKKSNDVTTVDSIVNAIEVCAIDPEVTTAGSWSMKIEVTTGGTTVTCANAKMKNAFEAIVPTTTKLKSDKWGTDKKFVIEAAPDGIYGKVKIVMVNTSGTGNAAFHEYTTNDKILKTS